MDEPESDPVDATYLAMVFEGGLIVVALAAGWLLSVDPLDTLRWTPKDVHLHAAALGWGVLAAVPMAAALLLADRFPLGPLSELKQLVERMVLPMFRRAGLAELAAISLLAGVGEEVLFRGLMQTAIAGWIGEPYGAWIALAVVSAVFGLCHALSRTYAVLAALIGAYLGLLFLWTGNLLAPIAAHALYDFFALAYLLFRHR
jgi:membrane protease YdiL (CAAX protease family)